MDHPESLIQQSIIQWASMCKYKDILRFMYHTQNGGSRNKVEGARFKREGVKSGVPDLCLPCARKGYHGLYIEVKLDNTATTKKSYLKPEQKEWMEFLIKEGYRHDIVRNLQDAMRIINWYLESGE